MVIGVYFPMQYFMNFPFLKNAATLFAFYSVVEVDVGADFTQTLHDYQSFIYNSSIIMSSDREFNLNHLPHQTKR